MNDFIVIISYDHYADSGMTKSKKRKFKSYRSLFPDHFNGLLGTNIGTYTAAFTELEIDLELLRDGSVGTKPLAVPAFVAEVPVDHGPEGSPRPGLSRGSLFGF